MTSAMTSAMTGIELGGIELSGAELVLGGVATFVVVSVLVTASAGARRARAVAEIARLGARPVSFVGPVLVTAVVIVGVQWVVITQATDRVWWWVALGLPALVTVHTLTTAMTVMRIGPTPRRRGGGRR